MVNSTFQSTHEARRSGLSTSFQNRSSKAQKLLPLLQPGSVVVIDKVQYQYENLKKVTCIKKDIQTWLSKKGAPWSSDMMKRARKWQPCGLRR